jgi:hypothetical protein
MRCVSVGQTFGAAQRCAILDSARELAIRDPQAPALSLERVWSELSSRTQCFCKPL